MNGIKTQCYIEEYKKGDGVSCRLREKVTNRIIIMEGDPDEHFSTFVSKTRDISDFLSDRDDYFDSNITESYIHLSGPIKRTSWG